MKLIKLIRNNYTRIILLAIGLTLAFISVSSYNAQFERNLANISKVKKESKITLKVASYPTHSDGKTKVICEVTDHSNKKITGTKTRLTINNPHKKEINYNDTLTLTGILEAAEETRVPGAFDYRAYLKSLDVTSQCYAEYDDLKISADESGLYGVVYKIRKNFLKSIDKYFTPECGGLVKAIMTGDRTGIDKNTSEDLKIAGVYHIVAISGLHLSIFISYITALFAGLKMKRFKKSVLTSLVCIFCSVFVLIFTGFGVSVIRAFAMLMVLFAANIFARDYSSKNSLVLSAFAIIIFIPYNLYNTAFYLSFLSTLGVLFSIDIMKSLKDREYLSDGAVSSFVHVVITSVLTIFLTLPVTVVSFGYIPLFSWLANLLILPIMAPLLGCGFVFALVSCLGFEFLSKLTSYAAHALSKAVIGISGFVANLPRASADVYPADAAMFTILLVIGAGCILLSRRFGMRAGIYAFLIFTVAFASVLKYNSINSNMTVQFVNVGQGDCTLVRTPGGNTALIDCGEQNADKYLAGNMKSFLRHENIKKIDTAFVSHFHTDHVSAMTELLAQGTIRNLVLPAYLDLSEEEGRLARDELLHCALSGNTKVYYMERGTHITLGGAEFEVISPSGDMYADNNNMSAIIKMTYGKNSFLFTGDIEAEAMQKNIGYDLKCDVLKVAHHGSKSGAADAFFEAASPKYAVISCGEDNSYGHPSPLLLDILNENSITTYRTDTDGGITFTLNKDKILKTETMR